MASVITVRSAASHLDNSHLEETAPISRSCRILQQQAPKIGATTADGDTKLISRNTFNHLCCTFCRRKLSERQVPMQLVTLKSMRCIPRHCKHTEELVFINLCTNRTIERDGSNQKYVCCSLEQQL
jgi:hypothetical protein